MKKLKSEIRVKIWAKKAKPRNGETKFIPIQYAKIILGLCEGLSEYG